MEQAITVLIYIHAFFGGIGLLAGTVSFTTKKGSVAHKKAGKLFSFGMLISALISVGIAAMPNHVNVFLLLIGLFTIYLVITGNRALTFNSKAKLQASRIDIVFSGVMFILALAMMALGTYGVLTGISNSILFLVFGGFGCSLTVRDFLFFQKYRTQKHLWVTNHIGKMVGAFIASITAFIVAGLGIDTLMAWISPSVLGTLYIMYWKRKVRPTAKTI